MSEDLNDHSGEGFRLEKSKPLELKPITADADIPSPDGEGANKGFWRHQLRDRKKQFAKMYGSVIFDSVMDGKKVSGHGTVVDILEGNIAVVKVKGNSVLPDGEYKIAGDQLEAAAAIIPDGGLPSTPTKNKPAAEVPAAPKLKAEISGDEALRIFKSFGENYAKSQGRLPIIRSNDDVVGGAKIMYASIHDDFKAKYPELYEKMEVSTPEEFAKKAMGYGVNNTTRYLDDPSLVAPEQIAINKVVAEKIFGIDPENGLIEYYRNAINHNSSPEKAAAGYASLDKNFAWDYGTYNTLYAGSFKENDGRYTIKMKPGEIQGLIGFSWIQDEYAALIPAYITENNPDRVTKVGPIQMRHAASYIDDSNTYNRSGGATPFRSFSTASTFEFFPLDEHPLPGESFNDFNEVYKDRNGGKITKISEWINSRYGEGDFQDIKNKAADPEKFYTIKNTLGKLGGKGQGVIPTYKDLQNLFVKTKDGKYGIDPIELDRVRLSVAELPEKNDNYEVILKILTGVQELSGKTFMVNRGHDPNDPRIPDVAPESSTSKKKVLENKSPDLPVVTEWYVDAEGKRIPDANLTDADKKPENKRVFDRLENTLVDGNGKALEFTPTYDKKASPLPEIAPDHTGFWDNNQVDPKEVIESHDVDEVVDILKRGGFVTTDPKTAFAASTKVDQLAKEGKLIDFKDGALVGEDKELSKALKDEVAKLPKQYQYRIQRSIDLDELTQDQGKELVQFLKEKDGKVSLEDLSEIHKNFRNLGIDITNMQVSGDKNFTQNSTGALRADMPQVTPENQPAFLDDLDRLGIGYKRTTTDVTKLTPVQAEMDMSKVGGMAKLFTTQEGWDKLTKNGTDYMFVTSDGYVIDGHHRWAGAVVSAWETGKPVDLPVIELDIPYDQALILINEWNDQHGVVRKKLRPERPKKPEAPKEEPKDGIDFTDFDQVSGPIGSNPGGVFKDPKTNKEYYVKVQAKERGENEKLASALYKEAGLDSLTVNKGTMDGSPVTYTEWRENLTPISRKLDEIKPDDESLNGYAIDAWLANWDVVGTAYDNLSFTPDGKPVRIDSGGALLYRARGERKDSAFGDKVNELDTFKNGNNTAAQLYSRISPEREKESVDKLRAITPERIDRLVDENISDPNDNKELKQKLKARREDILSQYPAEKEEPKPTTTEVPRVKVPSKAKSDTDFQFNDGSTRLVKYGRVSFQLSDDLKKKLGVDSVELEYTGSRVSDITILEPEVIESLRKTDPKWTEPGSTSYIFKLSNSPDESILPNGHYIIDGSDSIKTPFDPERENFFIGTEMPKPRDYTTQGAIDNYVGLGYSTINSYLRGEDTSDRNMSGVPQTIETLDAHLDSSTLDKDMELHRGFTVTYPDQISFFEKLQPGDVLEDGGYTSTTERADVAEAYSDPSKMNMKGIVPGDSALGVIVNINAKKGTKGSVIFRARTAAVQDEREVLLPRGAKMSDRIIITKVTKRPDGRLVIDAEYGPVSEPSTGTPIKVPATENQLNDLADNFDRVTPEQQVRIQQALGRGDMSRDEADEILNSIVSKNKPEAETTTKLSSDSPEWLEKAKTEYEENRNLMNGDSNAPTDYVAGDNLFDGFNATFLEAVPVDPATHDGKNIEIKRTPAPNQKIVNMRDRMVTLVDINGVMVPFYLSSGAGGKKDVEAGKWYPFFGFGEGQGWFNKANGKYINNYYGSPELRAQSEWLDKNIGDIRGDKSIPIISSKEMNDFISVINQDTHAVDNDVNDENLDTKMKANIGDIIKRVRMEPKPESVSAPTVEEPGSVSHTFLGKKYVFTPEEMKNARSYIAKGREGALDVTDEEGIAFNERMRALTDYLDPKKGITDETIPAQEKLMDFEIPVEELRHSAPPGRFDEITKNGIRPKITDKVGTERYSDRRFGVFLANGYTSGEAGELADVFRVNVPEKELRVDSGYTPNGRNLYIERTVKPEELEFIGHVPLDRVAPSRDRSFDNEHGLHDGRGADCAACKARAQKNKDNTPEATLEPETITPQAETPKPEPTIVLQEIIPKTNTEDLELNQMDADALSWYTDFGFSTADNYLRSGEDISDEDKASVDRLLKLMNSSKLVGDSVLYRGRPVSNQERFEQLNALEIGDVISDPGITSTSYDLETALKYANIPDMTNLKGRFLFKINAPDGTKAYKIDFEQATYKSDKEVILPPHSQMRVKNIDTIDGVKVLEFDLIHQESDSNTNKNTLESTEAAKPNTNWEPKQGATTGKGESERLDNLIDGDIIDLNSLDDEDAPISNFEKEDLPENQYKALYSYTAGGFRDINVLLRYNEATNAEKEATAREQIKAIDDLIDTYGNLDKKRTVYRGMVQYMKSENGEPTLEERMEALEPGDILSEPGYTSTSSNKFISFSEFGPGSGNKGDVETASGTIGTYGGVFMAIDIPEDSKALVIPKRGFNHASVEEEVLLPRNTSIKIKAIRKVPQIDSDGEETGGFNYYVDAEVVPQDAESSQANFSPASNSKPIEITKELRDSLDSLGISKTTYTKEDIKKISDLAKELSTSTGIKFSPEYFKTQSTEYMPEVLDAVNIQAIDQPATSNIDKAFKPSLEAKETKDKLVDAGKQILDLAEKDAEVRFRKDYDVPENMELEEFFKTNSEQLLSTVVGDLEAENERLSATWGEMSWLYGSGDQEFKDKAVSEFKKDLEERYGDMDDVFGKGWVDKLINYANNPNAKEVEEDRFLLDEIYRWHLATFPDKAKEVKGNKYYGSLDSITGVEEFKDRDGNTKYSGGMIRILSAYMLMDRPDIQEKYADIRRKINKIETSPELGKGMSEDRKVYQQYLRDSYMDIMRKAGVEFDSVTIEDFGSELQFKKISDNGRDFIDDLDIEKNKKRFEDAMKYVPKSVILSALNAIRYGTDGKNSNFKTLTIVDSKERARYYESIKNIFADSSDSLLHEFWHLLQYRNPNIKTLEHAWMYDRLVDDKGLLPNRFDIFGKDSSWGTKEYSFAKPGIVNPYTVKQYSTNEDAKYRDFEFIPYSPDGKGSATEVSTTLMQDLFTSPGEFSVGTGFTAVEGDDENRTLYSNAYQDPTTGIWYTDKTMSTKLNPKYVYGRSEDEPYDKEFKAFGIGMLLALNEWKDE